MGPLKANVKILEDCRVFPPKGSVPPLTIPLSYFDILFFRLPASHFLFLFSLPCSTSTFLDTHIPNLKHSLSLTLKLFYPLVGNLICDDDDIFRTVSYADGDSVAFTVAECDDDFFDLTADHPREDARFDALVPVLPVFNDNRQPVMAIQVTLFPGQGIGIGTTTHHGLVDDHSLALFLKKWASFSRSGCPSSDNELDPCYDRSVLPDFDRLYDMMMRMVVYNNKPKMSQTFQPEKSAFVQNTTNDNKIVQSTSEPERLSEPNSTNVNKVVHTTFKRATLSEPNTTNDNISVNRVVQTASELKKLSEPNTTSVNKVVRIVSEPEKLSESNTTSVNKVDLPTSEPERLSEPNSTNVNKVVQTTFKGATLSEPNTNNDNKMVRATFVLKESKLESLRQLAVKRSSTTCSSFALACAVVWSCMIKLRSLFDVEVDNEYDKNEAFAFSSNCRGRPNRRIPLGYFGNCIETCLVEMKRDELVGEDGWVKASVAIRNATHNLKKTKAPFERDLRSLMSRSNTMFGVSGSPNLGLYDLNFGWGRVHKYEVPTIGNRDTFSWCQTMSLAENRNEEEGGVEVGVILPADLMNEFTNLFSNTLLL